ncbi:protein phosphatase CheZ [Virgifigura deserti]|uniref:protein phosphatase CheZ n=1 Tax=Virgifigura deserti TaxID=2268457 RepID=UPI003CCC3358
MSLPVTSSDLAKRLESLQKRKGNSVEMAAIVEVVESVMASMEGDLSTVNLKLYAELESLARYIADAKEEIAALRPDDIRDEHLPTATDELEAIVGATEQATNAILEAVETIEGATGSMTPEVAAPVTDAVTRVYEACNFQDITGQRITKIVKALQHIETKVDALLSAFGEELEEQRKARQVAKAAEKPSKDGNLLNGPQLPDEATKQEDIDALLASFD